MTGSSLAAARVRAGVQPPREDNQDMENKKR
jgi:hypothetical protein